jgi:hypothetical protein
MDRSGLYLLLAFIAVAMIPIVEALLNGEAIVGASAVACCIVGAAAWALLRELRTPRRSATAKVSRRERDPARWS